MSILVISNPERDLDEGLLELSWLRVEPEERFLVASMEYAIEARMRTKPPIMFMEVEQGEIVISFAMNMTDPKAIGPLWKFRINNPWHVVDRTELSFKQFITALRRAADQLEQG